MCVYVFVCICMCVCVCNIHMQAHVHILVPLRNTSCNLLLPVCECLMHVGCSDPRSSGRLRGPSQPRCRGARCRQGGQRCFFRKSTLPMSLYLFILDMHKATCSPMDMHKLMCSRVVRSNPRHVSPPHTFASCLRASWQQKAGASLTLKIIFLRGQ